MFYDKQTWFTNTKNHVTELRVSYKQANQDRRLILQLCVRADKGVSRRNNIELGGGGVGGPSNRSYKQTFLKWSECYRSFLL